MPFRKLRNMIKKAVITMVAEDINNIQTAQIQYFGNIRNAEIISSYGLWGISPKGSQVVLMQVNGQEENLVGIADDINNRPKNLKEGEVIIKNTKTGNYIIFNEENDTIEVCNGNKNITITEDLNITVNGDCNITASNVDVNAINVDINASVTNLGIGGNAIARVGDSVSVNITAGSSLGTYSGTITSGGTNTSI